MPNFLNDYFISESIHYALIVFFKLEAPFYVNVCLRPLKSIH